MKKLQILAAIISAFAVSVPAAGQHFDPEHRHSIEISSGIPPIHTFLLGQGTYGRMFSGVVEDTWMRAAVNVGYTFAISEKWDVNAVINLAGQMYKSKTYPDHEVTREDGYTETLPDFNAEPIATGQGSRWWPAYMVDFRWKWYRSDSVRLYTAFGIGHLPGWSFNVVPVIPYLTPIGINFGKNHFYGIAELNASSAATLLLVGCGYRF